MVTVAVGAVGIAGAIGEVYAARDASAPPVPVDRAAPPAHDPTSHWLGLIGLRRDYPKVRWQEGVRYVDDGDLITTAGVLSGVDGAPRAIERMAGPAAARQAARALAWPAYHPGAAAPIGRPRPAPADLVGLLSAGYRWERPTTGVLLSDGVGEAELAAAFRPYAELSYLARPLAVSADGRPVRSRHGLSFAPRATLAAAAPRLERLVVPGADAARRAVADGLVVPKGLAPTYLHQRPGFAFDAAAVAAVLGVRFWAAAGVERSAEATGQAHRPNRRIPRPTSNRHSI